MLAHACKLGLEGIISKRVDGPIARAVMTTGSNRNASKSTSSSSSDISNPTPRPNAVGALVVGYYDRKRLVYAGRVGTGYTNKTASSLMRMLKPLRIDAPSFVYIAHEPAAARRDVGDAHARRANRISRVDVRRPVAARGLQGAARRQALGGRSPSRHENHWRIEAG